MRLFVSIMLFRQRRQLLFYVNRKVRGWRNALPVALWKFSRLRRLFTLYQTFLSHARIITRYYSPVYMRFRIFKLVSPVVTSNVLANYRHMSWKLRLEFIWKRWQNRVEQESFYGSVDVESAPRLYVRVYMWMPTASSSRRLTRSSLLLRHLEDAF